MNNNIIIIVIIVIVILLMSPQASNYVVIPMKKQVGVTTEQLSAYNTLNKYTGFADDIVTGLNRMLTTLNTLKNSGIRYSKVDLGNMIGLMAMLQNYDVSAYNIMNNAKPSWKLYSNIINMFNSFKSLKLQAGVLYTQVINVNNTFV